MIQSMTGYGRATCDLADKMVVIEIKALNSKQLDVNLRIPPPYREREMELRNDLANRLKRGKIDLTFTLEYKEGKQPVQINALQVQQYFRQIQLLTKDLGVEAPLDSGMIQTILRLPDSLESEKEVVDPSEWEKLQLAFQNALDNVVQFRSQEGKALGFDIVNRVNMIESLLMQIEPFETERLETLRSRLINTLQEMVAPDSIDMNRFEQELIYYLEKLDITEEKTRLRHHCHYFADIMKEPEQVGRKLIFLTQEIGREINTIGSKANHSSIQKTVVVMKDELEKIKEQLMNIL